MNTFPDLDTIVMLYEWGTLSPNLEFYVELGNITKEQYKEICGKDYAEAE